MSKALVCVPVYIQDLEVLKETLRMIGSVRKKLDPTFEIDWYVDANGCSAEVNLRLQEWAAEEGGVVHVEEQGCRPEALNRGLSRAREEGYGAVVFLNDDVFPVRGTIEALVGAVYEGEDVVGARSRPIDLSKSRLGDRSESMAMWAEMWFENRRPQPPFKGNCFAMDPSRIEGGFPILHSDDTWLRVRSIYFRDRDIKVLKDAQVWHFHDLGFGSAAERIARYLKARDELVLYYERLSTKTGDQKWSNIAEPFCRVPGVDEIRESLRAVRERLRGEEFKIDEKELLMGERANWLVMMAAVRRYLSPEPIVEDGCWGRSGMERR